MKKQVQRRQNREQKKQKKKEKGKKKIKQRALSIRTSPKNLMMVTGKMRMPQINSIKNMGFGSLFEMNIDSIPARLAHYVVDNFDTEDMVIRTRKWPIHVTTESVNQILGLKDEGVDINSIETDKEWDIIIKDWRAQFENKLIRPKDNVKKILASNSADWNFKLNFIVLFVNTMAVSMKMGTCNLAILSHLGKDLDLKDVNWCKYIIDCAKESKVGWNSESDASFYTGPITFLTLLYLDTTRCHGVDHKKIKPALKGWNTEMMKKREKLEISIGGFGRGELDEKYVEIEESSTKKEDS